jgi:hypothetical protein
MATVCEVPTKSKLDARVWIFDVVFTVQLPV